MAAGAEAPDSWYLALLGFAEHFRTSSPPKIRLCVHCLQAVFQFKPPQRVEARTHLQLGSVLYHHTKNSELARTHLEKAVRARRKDRGLIRATRPQSRPAFYNVIIVIVNNSSTDSIMESAIEGVLRAYYCKSYIMRVLKNSCFVGLWDVLL